MLKSALALLPRGYTLPEADWQRRHHGWDVPVEWVTPLPDVIAGLQAAVEHFTPPGSPIVLPTPAYMPFLTVPGLHRRIAPSDRTFGP